MMLKIKNRSQRDDINWVKRRHGHKYSKYKICLSIIMVIYNKQHLTNIWSWIHEKVEQSNTEAELKKNVAYKKNSLKCHAY